MSNASKSIVKDRVYRYLLQNLANEEWLAGQALPSLRATSQRLRVSHYPVHLVWQQALKLGLIERRGRATVVAEGAAEHAREILAQIAAKAKSKRLAVLISAAFNIPLTLTRCPFQAKLSNAVIDAGKRNGYEAELVSIHDANQLEQASQIVHKYDAAFSVELSPKHLIVMTHLVESRLPTVTFRRKVPGITVPSLSTDDFGSAKRVAQLFASEGHTNVSMVTSLHVDTILDSRMVSFRGWLEGLQEAGIYDQCVMPLIFTDDTYLSQIEKLMAIRPAITGLFLGIPPHLSHLASAPFFKAIRIPQDLSVATTSTMGRLPLPASYPPITSFEVEWERAGQCAIELLDKMMAGKTPLKNIRIPLNFLRTESIAPPPSRRLDG